MASVKKIRDAVDATPGLEDSLMTLIHAITAEVKACATQGVAAVQAFVSSVEAEAQSLIQAVIANSNSGGGAAPTPTPNPTPSPSPSPSTGGSGGTTGSGGTSGTDGSGGTVSHKA